MSRVDEAMRRAAEEATGSSNGNTVRIDRAAPDETAALAREPFPIEMPDRRRISPHAGVAAKVEAEKPRAEAAHAEPPAQLIERFDARMNEKVVVDGRTMPLSREQYRRLAAILHDAQAASGLKVIMVASAVAGEGKTLTAANLALTFSESYRKRVLLVDADLRKPMLHVLFRIDAAAGLSEGLTSREQTKLVVRQVSENLAVLPAGRPSNDPMAGLTSERMRRFLDEAKESFDWVIVDTPPLVLLPDAHLLSSMVDGAVIVVRANSTPHDPIKRAVDAIGKTRVIGVVLNCGPEDSVGAYHAEYYAPDAESVVAEGV